MNVKLNWFEIPASDFLRAVSFYNDIFDIQLDEKDWGDEKMAFFPKTQNLIEGSVSYSKNFIPSQNGVLISFELESDLNIFLIKVEKAGGKIIIPKTKIECEARGYFACFLDSEGNKLGCHSNI